MEILKREHNELNYLELIETLEATAKDPEFPRFSEFSVIIIAQKPKEKEPRTFQRFRGAESELGSEPKTFGKTD